ncbi:MAG: hypothetical protein D6731_12725 [Planctomycetota bacterium]|nr:MAG: hypothetical protein D6731_12725 [Planctomycetota bacterium]
MERRRRGLPLRGGRVDSLRAGRGQRRPSLARRTGRSLDPRPGTRHGADRGDRQVLREHRRGSRRARGLGGPRAPPEEGPVTRGARSFSLLEVIVALGVLAIGATAAFSLLVAAAAAGRRAEHQVNAALIADAVLDDLSGELGAGLRLDDYPLAAEADPLPGADPARAAPNSETRYLVRDAAWSAFPGYRYDLALTPLPGPQPGEPWHYLAEVEVRWSNRGRRRSAHFATVVLRRLSALENPLPGARR